MLIVWSLEDVRMIFFFFFLLVRREPVVCLVCILHFGLSVNQWLVVQMSGSLTGCSNEWISMFYKDFTCKYTYSILVFGAQDTQFHCWFFGGTKDKEVLLAEG